MRPGLVWVRCARLARDPHTYRVTLELPWLRTFVTPEAGKRSRHQHAASILTFVTLGRAVGGVFFGVPPTVCDPFPNIQAVRRTVGSDPAVVAWYDARVVQQKSLTSLSPAEQVLVGCRDL